MSELSNNQPDEMHYPTNQTTSENTRATNGPILAVLVLVLLILLGGLYFWFASLTTTPATNPTPTRPTAEQNNEPESTTAEAQTETLEVVSTSNEVGAIEADIEATDLDSLDAELNAIDAELEAALEGL